VDVSSETGRDPVSDLDTLRRELQLFQPALAAKPQIVVANKIDAVDDPDRVEALERHAAGLGLPFLRASGVTGAGVPEVLEALWERLSAERDRMSADVEVHAPEDDHAPIRK
jgi:GTP-binding protein